MTNSNYDIWAIQHFPEEVFTALDGLEETQDNTLYNNCISYLRVGDKKLYVQFDTAFYNEEKERLIILMKNGLLTRKKFKEILEQKKIPYGEVTFMRSDLVTQTELKEIWFAKDKNVLRDAIQDSKRKGIDICEYYPDLGGRFELRYPKDEEQLIMLDRQGIRGAMILDDKIIVLMSNARKENVKYPQALEILQETDMTPIIYVGERELPMDELPKQYKKEQ